MIKIEKWFEDEDETRRFYCKAIRSGLVGYGQAYSPEKAEKRATDDLIMREKNLFPVSINWENTPESFLADVKLGEVCVDFSPDMLELSMA
jgi:hypothetical protein